MAQSLFAVVNLWSQMEHAHANVVANITEADAVTVTAVHQAIISGEARKAALYAAASASLPVEDAALVRADVDFCEASCKQRNAFAHHLWDSVNGRPDLVVIMSPKRRCDLGRSTARFGQRSEARTGRLAEFRLLTDYGLQT